MILRNPRGSMDCTVSLLVPSIKLHTDKVQDLAREAWSLGFTGLGVGA